MIVRCGLAWDKARLDAPGRVKSLAFLSILRGCCFMFQTCGPSKCWYAELVFPAA
jgi:hypothetical protein